MLLKSIQPFSSIRQVGPLDLPLFTVVVGLNGAGKSHLLQGIEHRAIGLDILSTSSGAVPPGTDTEVVRLANGQITVEQAPAANALGFPGGMPPTAPMLHPQTGPVPGQRFASFDDYRAAALSPLEVHLSDLLAGSLLAGQPISELWRSAPTALADRLEWPQGDERRRDLQELFSRADQALLGQNQMAPGMNIHGDMIRRAAAKLSVPPREVTEELAMAVDTWGPHRQFNPHLPMLFARYRDAVHQNDLQFGLDKREGTSKYLDDEQFLARYGPPPWDMLSDILAEFGLDFKVAAPGNRPIDPVGLHLEKRDGSAFLQFEALSSGEKVLFHLAMALLKVDPIRATVMRPKLLLLDEMDASLHPEVLHRWIGALREKVVDELGIACILTTHSPVTVALVPEASLFQMQRDEPRLAKVSRREALNRLTVGLPALSVDFSGRRQVFVEADTDAGSYDRLHTLLKGRLQLPLSLHFLSTGVRRGKDEVGTGCEAVKAVVGKLEEYGSQSTFGLVDWDGKARPEGRIHVLGEGSYYAFDNLILHPLLIGLLLIKDGKPPKPDLIRFERVGRAEPGELQQVADAVQQQLSYPTGSASGRTKVEFLSGVEIETDFAFCLTNGHKIEDAIVASFKSLGRYKGQGRGVLADEVIERVIGDVPGLCPLPIVDAFRRLAEA